MVQEEPTPPVVQQLDWPAEPKTIDDLLTQYNIELKAPGRWPGTTLFLVDSKARNGKSENIVEGQSFKLFIAACLKEQTNKLTKLTS